VRAPHTRLAHRGRPSTAVVILWQDDPASLPPRPRNPKLPTTESPPDDRRSRFSFEAAQMTPSIHVPIFDNPNDVLLRLYRHGGTDGPRLFLRGMPRGHLDLPNTVADLKGGVVRVSTFRSETIPRLRAAKPQNAKDYSDGARKRWPFARPRGLLDCTDAARCPVAVFFERRWRPLHRIDDQLTFTVRQSTGTVSHYRDGPVRRRMRLGRRQVVDADVRIYVQEVRAVHAAAADGGMRAAVRLPGMPRACPPCPSDRTKLPYRVARSASGRRKVRAHHRRIARTGKIARSRM
jgi:hypothetical protein